MIFVFFIKHTKNSLAFNLLKINFIALNHKAKHYGLAIVPFGDTEAKPAKQITYLGLLILSDIEPNCKLLILAFLRKNL